MRTQISNFDLLKKLLKTVPSDGSCMEWPRSKVAFGYGQIKFKTVARAVHRVSYELSVGPIPEGLCALHKCDNPACFRPDHLFLGTKLDNMHDCRAKGRMRKRHGEGVNTAKLNEEQVREIRKLYAQGGITQQALANQFGIGQSKISAIVLRQHWKHVT